MEKNILMLILTEGCNLRCTYCYQHKSKVNFITEETQRSVIKYIIDNKVTQIDLFGGEPFIPENAKHLLKFLKDIKAQVPWELIIGATTNLYELTDDVIEVLEYILDNFKIQRIQVSADGIGGNDLRLNKKGESSYNKVLENIEVLCDLVEKRDMDIKDHIVMHSVVSTKTVDKIRLIVDRDPNLRYNLSIKPEHSGHDDAYDIDSLTELFTNLYAEYLNGDLTLMQICRLFELDLYGMNRASMRACNCGKKYQSFLPNGDQIPCHMCVGYGNIMGNINTGEYNNDYDFYDDLSKISYYSKSELTGEDCDFCPALSFCHTCKVANYRTNGATHIQIKSQCSWHKALYFSWKNIILDNYYDMFTKEEYHDWEWLKWKLEDKYTKDPSKDNLYRLRFLYLMLLSDEFIEEKDAIY